MTLDIKNVIIIKKQNDMTNVKVIFASEFLTNFLKEGFKHI